MSTFYVPKTLCYALGKFFTTPEIRILLRLLKTVNLSSDIFK